MTAQDYFKKIDAAYNKGVSGHIEETIKEAIALSKAEYGEDSQLYGSMLSELGGYYRGQTRFEESVQYCEAALKVLEKTVGANSPDYATGLNNLAGTYRYMRHFDKAEELFAQSLEIYRNTLGTEHVLYASGLNNLALVCLDKEELDRASKLLEEASAVLAKQPQLLDEYTTSLVNTASLYSMTGRYTDAEKNLLQAISNYENILGYAGTSHYHAALNTLGLVYMAQDRCEEACVQFEKSLEAAAHIYGTAHREYLSAKQNLENAQQRLSQSSTAQE